jgi:hypothetical protein
MTYTPQELQETFTELLRELSTSLDGEGIPWMLIGGLAVGAWTEPRGTKDCDFALALPADVAGLEARLRGVGLAVGPGSLSRAREVGTVRLRLERPDRPPLVVDLLCAGTEFEHEALARRRRLTVFGVPLRIASPDDLIIYKLVAGRPQDLADVDRLIRFQRAPEDEGYVRRWARAWDVEERLDRALADAQR